MLFFSGRNVIKSQWDRQDDSHSSTFNWEFFCLMSSHLLLLLFGPVTLLLGLGNMAFY